MCPCKARAVAKVGGAPLLPKLEMTSAYELETEERCEASGEILTKPRRSLFVASERCEASIPKLEMTSANEIETEERFEASGENTDESTTKPLRFE